MSSDRADARRNRALVLQATEQLVASEGVDRLRVADVARVAGVGAGTVYRAFGSKAGLLLGLLDERERELQEQVLRGDPPLGPGAPAAERLEAFVTALHQLIVAERAILIASEAGSALSRYRTGAYAAWRTHLVVLLGDLDASADAEVLADVLLAPLAAALQAHLIDDRNIAVTRVRDAMRRITADLVRSRLD